MLANYTQTVYEKFFTEPERVFVTAINDELSGLGDSIKFSELLTRTEEVVRSLLQEAEVQA